MPKTRRRITTIKHTSIQERDIIRVSGGYGDMQIRREGQVARVVDNGSHWDYVTRDGYSLLAVYRDGRTQPVGATIELMERTLDTPLFDWR